MIIKIKSREEIEKTLEDGAHKHNTSCMFNPRMFYLCGKVMLAKEALDPCYRLYTEEGGWHWHPDWYEVVEYFTDEDLMDIELMNEMLGYFLLT